MSDVSRVGETLKDKYVLEELLGAGGMGEVYRARNKLVDRTVAIKVLHTQHAKNKHIVERFMREAKAANVVRHRNIVDVLDIDRDDAGAFFIVQEYLEGVDLASHLMSMGGKLEPAECLDLIIPVARAVGEAHRRGVVHRDLKPDNVFLSEVEGEVVPKVLDFGISKLPLQLSPASDRAHMSNPDSSSSHPRLTEAGAAMGTPAYMSPEQIRDPATVDQRADVWALGVMLYELMSGDVPFDADDLAGLFAQICTHEPPPLERVVTGVPKALARVVRQCMRPDRDARYPSATEVAAALERCRDGVAGVSLMRSVEPADAARGGTLVSAAATTAAPLTSAPAVSAPPAVPSRPSDAEAAAMGDEDTLLSQRSVELSADPEPAAPAALQSGPLLEPEHDAPLALQIAAADIADRSVRPGARMSGRPRPSRASDRMPERESTTTIIVRMAIVVAVVGVVAVAAPYLAPARIAVLQTRFGVHAFVPYAVVAFALIAVGLGVLWNAARRVSFLLFFAALGALTLGAGATTVAALLAAPGLVPDLARKILIVIAPWSAILMVASLSTFAALRTREMRGEDRSLVIGFWVTAALGIVAALWMLRAPRASVDDVSAMTLVVAEQPIERQAQRLGLLLTGAAALEQREPSHIVRTTKGGEAAGSAVGLHE